LLSLLDYLLLGKYYSFFFNKGLILFKYTILKYNNNNIIFIFFYDNIVNDIIIHLKNSLEKNKKKTLKKKNLKKKKKISKSFFKLSKQIKKPIKTNNVNCLDNLNFNYVNKNDRLKIIFSKNYFLNSYLTKLKNFNITNLNKKNFLNKKTISNNKYNKRNKNIKFLKNIKFFIRLIILESFNVYKKAVKIQLNTNVFNNIKKIFFFKKFLMYIVEWKTHNRDKKKVFNTNFKKIILRKYLNQLKIC
jgi:hypothetical protein